MNRDFIRLKQLQGELKLTQSNYHIGCSVTSKELVLQKPHRTYHLFLSDLIGIVPVKREELPTRYPGMRHVSPPGDYYRLETKWCRIVTRSGVVEQENMQLIVPLSAKMLDYIATYSGLIMIR